MRAVAHSMSVGMISRVGWPGVIYFLWSGMRVAHGSGADLGFARRVPIASQPP